MELITPKQAAKHCKCSIQLVYDNTVKWGFFKLNGTNKWVADKKVFEERIKANDNTAQPASKEVKCQSRNVVKTTTLTSKRQMDRELGDLLARQTGGKP